MPLYGTLSAEAVALRPAEPHEEKPENFKALKVREKKLFPFFLSLSLSLVFFSIHKRVTQRDR
jgi:hypothetical protein